MKWPRFNCKHPSIHNNNNNKRTWEKFQRRCAKHRFHPFAEAATAVVESMSFRSLVSRAISDCLALFILLFHVDAVVVYHRFVRPTENVCTFNTEYGM